MPMAPTVAAVALLLCVIGVGRASEFHPAAHVDAARVTNAERDPGNPLSHGRTYDEQRFSPLSRISSSNAKQLGLAWFADLDTDRG